MIINLQKIMFSYYDHKASGEINHLNDHNDHD